MKDNFEHILNERLGELPEFSPEANAWENIQKGLRWEEELSDKIDELPQAEGLNLPWESLESAIVEPKKLRPRRHLKWISVAASIALLVGLGIQLINQRLGLEIEHELVFNYEQPIEMEDPILTIEALCMSGAPVCSTPAFEEKIEFYEEVSQELEQLNEAIEMLGESPDMVRSAIKMENLKSNTIQELIQMIHS